MKHSFKNNVSDRQFDSIEEFNKYIENTPLNDSFRWESLSSVKKGNSTTEWTKTHSLEEAKKLLKDGWGDMAKTLEQKLKLATRSEVTKTSPRPKYAVAGYQACVPRYLQGVPESMIYSKRVPVKQKVITINKMIRYKAMVSSDEIIEESIKALMIIAKLEAQGYRVHLNAVSCATVTGYTGITRICLKKASERLSIAKMAFPLVHPSMLRRLLFRYEEVNPDTPKAWVWGYGGPQYDSYNYFQNVDNAEYYIPPIIGDVDEFISKMGLK